MTQIQYLQGDATSPDQGIIAHIVNTCGQWGAGFVKALEAKYPQTRDAYLQWFAETEGGKRLPTLGTMSDWKLGNMLLQTLRSGLYVSHLMAQDNTRARGTVLVDYNALESTLRRLSGAAQLLNLTVHMPRIGCGIGGGKWSLVEPIIKRQLCDQGVYVKVYDLTK